MFSIQRQITSFALLTMSYLGNQFCLGHRNGLSANAAGYGGGTVAANGHRRHGTLPRRRGTGRRRGALSRGDRSHTLSRERWTMSRRPCPRVVLVGVWVAPAWAHLEFIFQVLYFSILLFNAALCYSLFRAQGSKLRAGKKLPLDFNADVQYQIVDAHAWRRGKLAGNSRTRRAAANQCAARCWTGRLWPARPGDVADPS